jgi:hypothetical protein
MSNGKITKETLQQAKRGGRKIVYNKTTGEFEVLQPYESVDPARQTEMKPTNIPNA